MVQLFGMQLRGQERENQSSVPDHGFWGHSASDSQLWPQDTKTYCLRLVTYLGTEEAGRCEPFLEVLGEMVPEEGVEPTRGVIPGRF